MNNTNRLRVRAYGNRRYSSRVGFVRANLRDNFLYSFLVDMSMFSHNGQNDQNIIIFRSANDDNHMAIRVYKTVSNNIALECGDTVLLIDTDNYSHQLPAYIMIARNGGDIHMRYNDSSTSTSLGTDNGIEFKPNGDNVDSILFNIEATEGVMKFKGFQLFLSNGSSNTLIEPDQLESMTSDQETSNGITHSYINQDIQEYGWKGIVTHPDYAAMLPDSPVQNQTNLADLRSQFLSGRAITLSDSNIALNLGPVTERSGFTVLFSVYGNLANASGPGNTFISIPGMPTFRTRSAGNNGGLEYNSITPLVLATGDDFGNTDNHCAITFNNSDLMFYINGNLVFSERVQEDRILDGDVIVYGNINRILSLSSYFLFFGDILVGNDILFSAANIPSTDPDLILNFNSSGINPGTNNWFGTINTNSGRVVSLQGSTIIEPTISPEEVVTSLGIVSQPRYNLLRLITNVFPAIWHNDINISFLLLLLKSTDLVNNELREFQERNRALAGYSIQRMSLESSLNDFFDPTQRRITVTSGMPVDSFVFNEDETDPSPNFIENEGEDLQVSHSVTFNEGESVFFNTTIFDVNLPQGYSSRIQDVEVHVRRVLIEGSEFNINIAT